MARIKVERPTGELEFIQLTTGIHVVGREVGDVVLGDPAASATHAQIQVDADTVSIRDLGSTNGTFDSEGKRLADIHFMQPHQAVRVGATTLTLMSPSAERGRTVLLAAPSTSPGVAEGVQESVLAQQPRPDELFATGKIAGQTVALNRQTGVVLHAATNYSTQVHGSGGGGYVGPSVFGGTSGRIDPCASARQQRDTTAFTFG